MIGAEVLRHPALPSNGVVEHPAKSHTIDGSGMDSEPHDATRVLIHDDQDPVSPQRGRFAPEQIYTPEAVLQVSNEGQPGWTPGVLFRSVVTGENPRAGVGPAPKDPTKNSLKVSPAPLFPSNHVFVDGDVESQ